MAETNETTEQVTPQDEASPVESSETTETTDTGDSGDESETKETPGYDPDKAFTDDLERYVDSELEEEDTEEDGDDDEDSSEVVSRETDETKEEGGEEQEIDSSDESSQTATDVFDPEILSIAADLGVSDEHAKSFSTVRDLETHLRYVYQQKESAKKSADSKSPKPEDTPVMFELKLDDPDSVDPELKKAIEDQVNAAYTKSAELTSAADKRVAALENRFNDIQHTAQVQQAETMLVQFDKMIDGLSENGEWKKTYGEGSSMTMKESANGYGKRQALMRRMVMIQNEDNKSGSLTYDEVFMQAHASLNYQQLDQIARKRMSGKVKKAAGRKIRRPQASATIKSSDTLSDEEAYAELRNSYVEHGIT